MWGRWTVRVGRQSVRLDVLMIPSLERIRPPLVVILLLTFFVLPRSPIPSGPAQTLKEPELPPLSPALDLGAACPFAPLVRGRREGGRHGFTCAWLGGVGGGGGEGGADGREDG